MAGKSCRDVLTGRRKWQLSGHNTHPQNHAVVIANFARPGDPFRMPGDLRLIIDDIANRADDFLAGVRDRRQARAGIEELLTMDDPTVSGTERTVIITGVMSALEDEDFFDTEYVGDAFGDEDETDD